MNEQQFRQRLREAGFGEGETKDYPPHTDSPMHSHDFSVMLYVISGEFMLAKENGVDRFRPGEVCELAAGIPHAERTGPDGARVLLGRK